MDPATRRDLDRTDLDAGDDLVTDKWIALVAMRPDVSAQAEVRELLNGPRWTPTNPNRVRAG